MKAYEALEKKLAEDGAVGTLNLPGGFFLTFEGRERKKEPVIESISEFGELQGELVQIGGRDESISVYLRDGDREYICSTSRSQGKLIAQHVFCQIEVSGMGVWHRDEQGSWRLDSFVIRDFLPLAAESLSSNIARLRALPKPDVDPIVVLAGLRDTE